MSPLARRCAVLALVAIVRHASGQAHQAPDALRMPELTRQKLPESQVAVRFAPDNSRFAVSGQNRGIRQFDRSGKELAMLTGAPGGWCVVYSPDSKQIAASGLDRTIRLWDAETGAEIRRFEGHSQTAWEAHFSPDGRMLISVGEDATVRFWSVADGKELGQLLGHAGPIWCMALSPCGQTLATGGSDGVIRLWDLGTYRLRRTCIGQHSGGVWPLTFSPDGRTIASGGWQDGKVYLWEIATGQMRRQIPHASGSKSLAFAPGGRTLFSAGNDHFIRTWSLLDGSKLDPLAGHTNTVNAIAMASDGQALASASNDGTVRTWAIKDRLAGFRMNPLPQRQVESHWSALRREDGLAAFDALGALASTPEQTVAMLRARVRPAGSPDVQRISTLIQQTGHAKFAVRQKATGELEDLGLDAEMHLQKAVRDPLPLESRRRAERLLQQLQNGGPAGEGLRTLRAVELLERIGTAEARTLLANLADGATEARLTHEAQASLKRMPK